ncbi:MAG: septum formation initiator family protein [Acidimicrobiia bacterium]
MADRRRRARPDRERVAPRRESSSRAARTRTPPARTPGIRRVSSAGDRTPPPTPKRSASARVVRRRRVLIGIMCGLAIVGFLFAFVYPTRTYLGQRDQISRAQNRLDVLQQQTAALERDTERLRGDTEVERIAREQYGLGRPGETRYVLVPAKTTTSATAPPATP